VLYSEGKPNFLVVRSQTTVKDKLGKNNG